MNEETDTRFLAVKRIIDGYTDALNHREWDKVEGFFLPDATWRTANFQEFGFSTASGIASGLRQIVDAMDMLVQMPAATVIEFDGSDSATARSSVQEIGKGAQGSFFCLGSYADTLRLVEGNWRFATRVFTYLYWDASPLPGEAFKP